MTQISILINPDFDSKTLKCVEVIKFDPKLTLEAEFIPILTSCCTISSVYINEIQLSEKNFIKTEIVDSNLQHSVLQLENQEYTENCVINKFGNYRIVLNSQTTVYSITFAFEVINSPSIIFNKQLVRRGPKDITSFIPLPLFLMDEPVSFKIRTQQLHCCYTTSLCVPNDFFFVIADLMYEQNKQSRIYFDETKKLFDPQDYFEILDEMDDKLEMNEHTINFFVDNNTFEVENYEGFSVIPAIDFERNSDQKYLEMYYFVLRAFCGEIFTFPVETVTDKRAELIIESLAELIISQKMLSEEENEWNLYNLKLNWGVYCNSALPCLWSENYENQEKLTVSEIRKILTSDYSGYETRAINTKWSGMEGNNNNLKMGEIKENSEDMKEIFSDLKDFEIDNNPEEEENCYDFALFDFSYPRNDQFDEENLYRLRAKIIAETIFNNSEDFDNLLNHFEEINEFSLSEFFGELEHLECSENERIEVIGVGPEANLSEFHEFTEQTEENEEPLIKNPEFVETIKKLGYINTAPRFLLFDKTEQNAEVAKFELYLTNYSESNCFNEFINSKLESFDGISVQDFEVDFSQRENKVCDDVIEKQSGERSEEEIRESLSIIDPSGALPFLVTSRWMSCSISEEPATVQIYPKLCHVLFSEGSIPYQSVIEDCINFGKMYYENFLCEIFEFLVNADFHLREIAITSIYRFYAYYTSEDNKYELRPIREAIKQLFNEKIYDQNKLNEKELKYSKDANFCLELLIDENSIDNFMSVENSMPNDYTVGLAAVLLGYIPLENVDIFFKLIEYDKSIQSNNNFITTCALQGLVWQLQNEKSKLHKQRKEILDKIYNIFSAKNTILIVKESILKLLAFLMSVTEKNITIDIFDAFNFEYDHSKCECQLCKGDDIISINEEIEFFSEYIEEFRDAVMLCIKALFGNHSPAFSTNGAFVSFVSPQFLLEIARPGEYYLRKFSNFSELEAPNAVLDWLIKDAYSKFSLTDVAVERNELYDCEFCYLGGSCTCSKDLLPRSNEELICQYLKDGNQNSKNDIILEMYSRVLESERVQQYYRNPHAFTDQFSIRAELTQTSPPEIAPLLNDPSGYEQIWYQEYVNRLKCFCSCGCEDANAVVNYLLNLLKYEEEYECKKQIIDLLSQVCGLSFINPEELEAIEELASEAISRQFAVLKEGEDETYCILMGREVPVRVYLEEYFNRYYIERYENEEEDEDSIGKQHQVLFGCLPLL